MLTLNEFACRGEIRDRIAAVHWLNAASVGVSINRAGPMNSEKAPRRRTGPVMLAKMPAPAADRYQDICSRLH